ncbi:hypothetical protein ACFW04_014485 [Cataglyphis niger]
MKIKYRNIIGALLHIANGPNILFSVNYSSYYQNCHNNTHFNYALRILKYMKSTTGILIQVFGNAILWRSQKQRIVSRTLTYAEYYALSDCVEKILPIRCILIVNTSVEIYDDNTGAIALSKNGNFSKNFKHIDISYHFVNDYEKKQIINVQKISSDDQIADTLFKNEKQNVKNLEHC